MPRTITVKGTGKVISPVDFVEISLTVLSTDADYSRATCSNEEKLIALKSALAGVGFDDNALKTKSYNVCAEYKSEHSENGYSNKFVGYKCSHGLVLEFDFDNKTLSDVICAVTNTIAEPNLYVRFTVKDKDSVCNTAIENACRNATEKAKILCEASGVELCEIVNITYSDIKPSLYSECDYSNDVMLMRSATAGASINPQDVEASDNVTITWTIK